MTCDPLAYTGGGQLGLLMGFAIACLVAGALLLLMTRRRGRVLTVALFLLVGAAAISITAGTPGQAIASECPPAENSLPGQNGQNSLPDSQNPPPGQNPLPTDENPIPTDQNPSTTVQSPLPTDENSVPTDLNEPVDETPVPTDENSVPTDLNEPVDENSLTIVQTSVMEGLAPGIAPAAITGIVTNNGPDSTYIIEVDVEIVDVVADPGAAPGVCDASDYVLLDSRMPVGRTLQPGGSTGFTGAAIGFNNKSTNQDSCKGATIQLLYTANPG